MVLMWRKAWWDMRMSQAQVARVYISYRMKLWLKLIWIIPWVSPDSIYTALLTWVDNFQVLRLFWRKRNHISSVYISLSIVLYHFVSKKLHSLCFLFYCHHRLEIKLYLSIYLYLSICTWQLNIIQHCSNKTSVMIYRKW